MSAKVLSEVRTKFVQNVSLPVLKQLLDDLIDQHVLNEEEKESVTEEHKTRADKARCLIDMVRKKGNTASEKMIKQIQERDPNLYEELGVACTTTVPAQLPLVSNPDESSVSAVLLTSSEQFKSLKLQEGDRIYKTLEKPGRKRLALLINNVKFDYLSLRKGAERDEERMEFLLKGLGYEVVKHKDLSGEEMDKAVKDFSKREEHAASDSTFVVIMSHGKKDAILGVHFDKHNSNPDVFPINNIYTHLNTKGCPALHDKPKVILIAACRGDETGSAFVPDGIQDDSTAIESDDHMEHQEKHFIALLSCTPDTKSYRHVEQGTFFVQFLVEVFNSHAHQDHIEELFMMVMRRFEKFNTLEKVKQMVCKERTTLSRHFYLFPGL